MINYNEITCKSFESFASAQVLGRIKTIIATCLWHFYNIPIFI